MSEDAVKEFIAKVKTGEIHPGKFFPIELPESELISDIGFDEG